MAKKLEDNSETLVIEFKDLKNRSVQKDDLVQNDSEEDYVIGYAPILYLKNKTDYPLLFIARDGKINGVQMSPLFADQVSPGCGSVTRVIYYDSSLEEAGIDKSSISSIELALQVIKTDTYDSIMEETFTLK